MFDLFDKLALGFRTCWEIVWMTDPLLGVNPSIVTPS